LDAVETSPRLQVPALSIGAYTLIIGFAALALPTAIRLFQQSWSDDFGAYGPIVVAAGGWLLWRELPLFQERARPGPFWLTLLILLPSALVYVYGRAFDFLTLEAAGLYGVGLAILHDRLGLRLMAASWFPIAYLAFVVPVPVSILTDVTAPLKEFVSNCATLLLSSVGYPVSREGVVIFVAQYQLLVEDACSGMNSLVGLSAVSLLYIYLIRGTSWIYSIFLIAFVIPIAIAANVVRIIILVLMTYYLGNEVAQGFLHQTAGMVLFVTSLLLIFSIDTVASRFFNLKAPGA
jgi:exosortase